MSYIDRINECNQHDLHDFKPFWIDGEIFGWFYHAFAEHLRQWPDIFSFSQAGVTLTLEGDSESDCFCTRTRALHEVCLQLSNAKVIKPLLAELYPIKTSFHQPAKCLLDRTAAPFFGLRTWGQHLNGYVMKNNQITMWIGTRSKDKPTFPGKLDNMVAGGLPHRISLTENLVKEGKEEASVPESLMQKATPVSAISYCLASSTGLKPDVMFCYDLQLPENFLPVCQDGEVEEFVLLPIEEVAEIVRNTDRFKRNCDLVIIDFLIRHGVITPDEDNYLELVTGLRSPFYFRAI